LQQVCNLGRARSLEEQANSPAAIRLERSENRFYLFENHSSLSNAIGPWFAGEERTGERGVIAFFTWSPQLLFAPAPGLPNRIYSRRHRNPIYVRRNISDFSLNFYSVPQPEASLLFHIIELNSEISGTNAGNCVPQERSVLNDDSVESRLCLVDLRLLRFKAAVVRVVGH